MFPTSLKGIYTESALVQLFRLMLVTHHASEKIYCSFNTNTVHTVVVPVRGADDQHVVVYRRGALDCAAQVQDVDDLAGEAVDEVELAGQVGLDHARPAIRSVDRHGGGNGTCVQRSLPHLLAAALVQRKDSSSSDKAFSYCCSSNSRVRLSARINASNTGCSSYSAIASDHSQNASSFLA